MTSRLLLQPPQQEDGVKNKTMVLHVMGMMCQCNCAATVERALEQEAIVAEKPTIADGVWPDP
jgi:hypothetical protein